MPGDDRPKPPVPHDLDLRRFRFMPIQIENLFNSDLLNSATNEILGAAFQLWCRAWHQVPAGSLPSNDAVLASFAGYKGNLDQWTRVREQVLHGFYECDDGRLYHRVIVGLALDAAQISRARSRAGKASAKARGETILSHGDTKLSQREFPFQNQGVATHVQQMSTNDKDNRESPSRDSSLHDRDLDSAHTYQKDARNARLRAPSKAKMSVEHDKAFEAFWKAYPPRVGGNPRHTARKAFLKAIAETSPEEIMKGVERYTQALRDNGDYETRFTAMASTWLNQKRWVDEPVESKEDREKREARERIVEHNRRSKINGNG